MSDQLTTAAPDNGKTELSQWDKSLADFKARYSAISTTDAQQYEPRRLAVKEMRETRGRIEERRLELGRPLLKAKKDIDEKAFWLIAEVEKIEEPLRLANRLIDEEAARLKKLAEQDERDKAQQATKAALDALAERQRKEADAERAKLKEQADALAAEKAKADAAAKTAREEAARVMAENNRQREALAAEQKKFREVQESRRWPSTAFSATGSRDK